MIMLASMSAGVAERPVAGDAHEIARACTGTLGTMQWK